MATEVTARNIDDFHSRRDKPDEVLTDNSAEYDRFRKITDFREPYRISHAYLQGTKPFNGLPRPETPMIAFINAKSGGYVGARLAAILYRGLGQGQVFDVAICHPLKVLKALWSNLKAKEASGDVEAAHVRHNLRILVAGGDGTITWVLGCIHQLQLDPMPAVGMLPLGTGNDLSLSMGWGKAFNWKWVTGEQLYDTLVRYRDGEVRFMDCWDMTITAPGSDYFEETPHSLRIEAESRILASGMFWNYYSVGLDAQAAYSFHALREKHPHLTSGRMLNQTWYATFSCTSGWFCGAPPITNKLRLRVKTTEDGEWQDITLPRSVKAIALLNLQSYGGGRDVWGLACTKNMQQKGLVNPAYDDGLIEIVGFHSGWHTAAVMGQVSSKVHAKRVAQAVEVELQLEAHGRVKDASGVAHMQLDGEPWPQKIPAAGASSGPLVIHVKKAGMSKVLFNKSHMLGGKQEKMLAQRGGEISSARSLELVAMETSRSELILQ